MKLNSKYQIATNLFELIKQKKYHDPEHLGVWSSTNLAVIRIRNSLPNAMSNGRFEEIVERARQMTFRTAGNQAVRNA